MTDLFILLLFSVPAHTAMHTLSRWSSTENYETTASFVKLYLIKETLQHEISSIDVTIKMLQQQKAEQEHRLQATLEEVEKKKDKLDYVVRLQTAGRE
ncbi:hypothetical protein M422DRAFT_272052 [Sphaerobolus stellatus SS14]|uniref:Uncharacterized protein n=1 Tax=Sphaerobolus stellatus (strain SS14) TaxID=990650 RepID=A0A0C9UNI7_SPHS4|nr:hypothetical protein M422DRAFT_272052 [Sphaerobolus stellatus SS14]